MVALLSLVVAVILTCLSWAGGGCGIGEWGMD